MAVRLTLALSCTAIVFSILCIIITFSLFIISVGHFRDRRRSGTSHSSLAAKSNHRYHHANKSKQKRIVPNTAKRRPVGDQRNHHGRYFECTAIGALVCNLCVCLSTSIFFMWMLVDSELLQKSWHIEFFCVRLPAGLLWFVGKYSLICLYNGRLYFTARNKTTSRCSYAIFIMMNIWVICGGPALLTSGYLAVWRRIPWLITLSFESNRAMCCVLSIFLLSLFVHKMLTIHTYRVSHAYSVPDEAVDADSIQEEREQMRLFLEVTTKYAVLLLFIAFSALFVSLAWISFNYVFPTQNLWTLHFPLMVFAFDSTVDSVCIYLMFAFGSARYDRWCQCIDDAFRKLLFSVCVRRKTMHVTHVTHGAMPTRNRKEADRKEGDRRINESSVVTLHTDR